MWVSVPHKTLGSMFLRLLGCPHLPFHRRSWSPRGRERFSLHSCARHTEQLQNKAEAISSVTVDASLTTRQPYQQVFYKLSLALKPPLRLLLHRILSFIQYMLHLFLAFLNPTKTAFHSQGFCVAVRLHHSNSRSWDQVYSSHRISLPALSLTWQEAERHCSIPEG